MHFSKIFPGGMPPDPLGVFLDPPTHRNILIPTLQESRSAPDNPAAKFLFSI